MRLSAEEDHAPAALLPPVEEEEKEEGWEGTVKHCLLVHTSAHTLHLGMVESLHLLVLFSYECF